VTNRSTETLLIVLVGLITVVAGGADADLARAP
jgi:hypothetical protein